MKIHKHTNRNRDAPDFMGLPDQPSYGGSNKPTFSQIAQALPDICPKSWRWWQQLSSRESVLESVL